MSRIFEADLPIAVSLKTRVGYRSPDEFENLVDIYARFPMMRLIVHPRLKTDLYRGDVRLEVLDKVLSSLPMPLGYNGDLITPEDIEKVSLRYSGAPGGRSRPLPQIQGRKCGEPFGNPFLSRGAL